MKIVPLLSLVATLGLSSASAAFAQVDPAASPPGAPVNPPSANATTPAASDASSPVAAVAPDPAAPKGSTGNPIPESSPTPPAMAGALVASDPTVVSNGPVPDTKANRAKYGQPMSDTGRATKPAGN
jgi:hypothetical protein